MRSYPRGIVEKLRFRVCRWLGPKLWLLGYQLALYGATNEELTKHGEDLQAMGYDKPKEF